MVGYRYPLTRSTVLLVPWFNFDIHRVGDVVYTCTEISLVQANLDTNHLASHDVS